MTVEQQTKRTELSRKLTIQQNALVKDKLAKEDSTHARFIVTHKVAKYNKFFSDGELLKMCMIDVVDQVCPRYRKKFEDISLSRRTMTLK